MRPIKYQAWLTVKKEMVDVMDIEFHPDGTVESICTIESKHKPPCFELLQFTGFLDKNGKELWEGDIVHYHHDYDAGQKEFMGHDFDDKISVVKWSEDSRRLEWYGAIGKFVHEHHEVIGNIYQNTDLYKNVWTLQDFVEGRVRIDFVKHTGKELDALRKICKLINPNRDGPAYSFQPVYYCKNYRWYEGAAHNNVSYSLCRATEIVI